MYIPIKPLLEQYKILPKGVIQVGCHWCEEHEHYLECGVNKFAYIEPCREAFDKTNKLMYEKYSMMLTGADGKLVNIAYSDKAAFFEPYTYINYSKGNYDINLYKVACGAEEKEVSMYISHQNQGQSNSILKSNLHSIQHPEIIFDDTEIVKMVTLDSLPIKKEDYNILVTDCEGYDGEVMKGAKETLKHIDFIYSEINRGETRIDNMLIDEFEQLLWDEGFVMIKTFWPSPNFTWGDAVFVRRSLVANNYPLTSEDLDML